MNNTVLIKNYSQPPFRQREILRYSGCREADSEITALADACISEVKDKLTYKVCYCQLSLSVIDDVCDFGIFKITSRDLAKSLSNCRKVILFAATVGVEIDRIIAKYGKISPSKAVMIDAIGAERIEALCDVFCDDIQKEMGSCLKNRFSPGYGDLPLTVQKEVFALLDCTKRIGLSLNDSLLMSPSKSVTAFVGISSRENSKATDKCSQCNKSDCLFRGAK